MLQFQQIQQHLTTNFAHTDNYNLASSENAIKRARQWIGEQSNRRVVEKIIPLPDLTNIRCPGLLTNAFNVSLEITWKNTTDIMTHFTLANTEGAQGTAVGVANGNTTWLQFNVIACDLVSDNYLNSPEMLKEQVQNKFAGETERLIFEKIETNKIPYTGGQVTLTGKTNLQRVIIYDFVKGMTNGRSGDASIFGGNQQMTYNSPSQTTWGGYVTSTDANYPWMLW